MKVVALIYGGETRWESVSDEDRTAIREQHRVFGESANGKIVGGAGHEEAARAYRRALELTRSEPERRFLSERLQEVGAP